MALISLIVPCYNEKAALPAFSSELDALRRALPEHSFQVIFVDDGSTDDTADIIKAMAAADSAVKYICFSRNFGKEAAIYAGLGAAKGDYTAILDADLQDPPSMLPEMLEILQNEDYDCVATRRVNRKGEPVIRSAFARLFYACMRKWSRVELMDGARDFRLMTKRYVGALMSLCEYNRFSKGLFGWIGFNTKWLEYENVARVAGTTKWSFWKLVRYAADGIISFSSAPLMLSTLTGMFFCLLSFALIVFIVIRALMFGDPVTGWPSLMCAILFIGGVQLFCTGILGQYMAKTYLETKRRPVFICKESNLEN